jgi:N-acetylmuramoyl-L-alanine amidase
VSDEKKIVIIPGHSQYYGGAFNEDLGLYEYDIASNIVSCLSWLFNDFTINHETYAKKYNTRIVGVDSSKWHDMSNAQILRDKVGQINQMDNVLFAAEVHLNASTVPAVHGSEIIYFSKRGKQIAEYFKEHMQVGMPKIKFRRLINMLDLPRNLYFLRKTICPAIIFEVGFISNYQDASYLASFDGTSAAAQTLLRGIVDYLKLYAAATRMADCSAKAGLW